MILGKANIIKGMIKLYFLFVCSVKSTVNCWNNQGQGEVVWHLAYWSRTLLADGVKHYTQKREAAICVLITKFDGKRQNIEYLDGSMLNYMSQRSVSLLVHIICIPDYVITTYLGFVFM